MISIFTVIRALNRVFKKARRALDHLPTNRKSTLPEFFRCYLLALLPMVVLAVLGRLALTFHWVQPGSDSAVLLAAHLTEAIAVYLLVAVLIAVRYLKRTA